MVLPMSMPSRSLSNSERWVWLAPSYIVRARCTTLLLVASGVALVGWRPRWPWARDAAPLSLFTVPCDSDTTEPVVQIFDSSPQLIQEANSGTCGSSIASA